MLAGDAALDHPTEALAGVLIDDGCDLDRPPVGGDVELEVHRPHPVWRVRGPLFLRGGAAVAFAASSLRHSQAFLTPKALDLLVIDNPALAAGVMVSGPEPATGMILGVVPEPRPQGGIGILGRGRHGLVALGGAVLPGHPAGEPFADSQHPLEVMNGCPPAFRA